MKTKKKRFKRMMIALPLFIAAYLTYINSSPPIETVEVDDFKASLALPPAQVAQNFVGDTHRATSPHAHPSLLSTFTVADAQKKTNKGRIDLFLGIDQTQLVGRIKDLPLHRRIPIGEELKYNVMWNGVHVGDAIMSTSVVTEDPTQTLISASVHSYAALQYIYPVNDYFYSRVDSKTCNSRHYVKNANEGLKHRQDVISVDPLTGIARYQRFNKEGEERRHVTYDITTQVSDPLSIIYLARGLDLKNMSEPKTLNVLNNKRLSQAQMIRDEDTSVSVPQGTFECYQFKVDTNYAGLFKEAPENKATVYLEKNSHVLIKGEVSLFPIGHIAVVMSGWKAGKAPEK